MALPLTDGTNYLLGNFASVAEVKEWMQSGVQLTTNLKGDLIVDQLVLYILGTDPDVPKPDPDGTQYMSVHVHITDKTGAGLLIEGTANGSYALYDTRASLMLWHKRHLGLLLRRDIEKRWRRAPHCVHLHMWDQWSLAAHICTASNRRPPWSCRGAEQ
jgi:hypothetical protein